MFSLSFLLLLVWRFRLRGLIFASAFVLGIARFSASEAWAIHDQVREYSGIVQMRGVIAADVDLRLDEQRFVLRVEELVQRGKEQRVRGRTLVVAPRYPERRYGEQLSLRCSITIPEPVEQFAYDEYLALSRVYSICRKPDILAVERPPPSISGALFTAKHWMVERISAALPEPHAALLSGILLGVRQGIPETLTTAFQRAGLSHIVALSGYNVTILVAAVMGGAIRLGGSRRGAFWIAALFILCFVMMTGAAASVVRAGVMGFLVCLARHVGRVSRIWYALVFAATVMVALNPRILLHDVGFQLSFFATLGLVLFATPISGRLGHIPERFGLRDALASTLAATIATAPLLVTQFERLSLISPIANLLVLPVVPMLMFFGTGVLIPFFAPMLAGLSWVLLTWVITWSEWLSRLPWASVAIPALPAWTPFLWYGVGVLSVVAWKNTRHTKKTTE